MKLRVLLAFSLFCLPAFGQNHWVVKPEWVRAHEEFLASDVMAGRGSATRDEQIAATYVASEFMAYGLKPAPGMQGYLQAAELSAPALQGNATLTVGDVTLHEGADFALLTSGGESVKGFLTHAPSGPQGSVVLTSTGAMAVMRAATSQGAVAVLLPEDKYSTALMALFGGKTRMSIQLKEGQSPFVRSSAIVLKKAALDRISQQKDGTPVEISVHLVPETEPRKTYNAIGYLEGTDPASGTILLTAHLDHLGTGHAVNGDAIYNGANDDAAGTTAVLELAHALASPTAPRPKRNILFVCYGSEEIGGLGSTFFGNHPPVPLTSLVTNLEFEMIGTQDPKMPKGVLLLTGWERSNLGPTLKQHGALLGPDPYPEQHFFERSDNYSLAVMGVVAHTAAGWGTPPTYHQPSDDLAHLDITFMTAAIQSLVEPVRWLASSDFKPTWNPGGKPEPRKR